MRCKGCQKTFKPSQIYSKKCWTKFNRCMLCTVIDHPEEYPKNIVFMTLAKAGKYKSTQRRGKTRIKNG